ncbi:MAG: cysteine synthase A [Succinivibrionaceae bacterium]|nr:cysteine synthase A [Succinivibrionaceae bacterium]MEE1340066.1 cysteine synthase A [Succinivibrionaceae bacterium]
MALYNNAAELVGNTPLLRLNNLEKKLGLSGKLYAKLEMFNPTGSIKDRAALNMIKEALADGTIKEGATIIEPTSGNTGIGLAFVAKLFGLKAVIVMPDSMSVERQILMKARGANLVLTPGKQGMKGAVEEAQRIHDNTPGSLIVGQFYNAANPRAHELYTAAEIYKDLDGKVDVVVAGVGTGGTISGLAKGLKNKGSKVKAIAVEPFESSLISQGVAGPHKIQGIGANFIPENYDKNVVDEVIRVKGDDAIATTKELNRVESILAGISSGANLWAAIEEAKKPENKDKNIVAILPDTGEHYLSLGIFSE